MYTKEIGFMEFIKIELSDEREGEQTERLTRELQPASKQNE